MTFPSKITSGFNIDEATLMLSIAQQTYNNTPDMPSDKTCVPCPVDIPVPTGWSLVSEKTPTDTTLLDNFWQVWRNDSNHHQYTIAVRGTVGTYPSILADLLLPMIKARIDLAGLPMSFNLAQDEGDSPIVAAVQSGFTLSLILMLITTNAPLALTLFELAQDKDAEIYITGHSQGASVALLLTSLVLHTRLFQGPTYKTYVFAPAKPGNDHYANDLDQHAGALGNCYSIISSQDWVPEVPLTLQGLGAVNRPNPVYQFSGKLNPAIPTPVQDVINDITEFETKIFDDIIAALKRFIGDLEGKLLNTSYPLTSTDLGMQGEPVGLDSSTLEKYLQALLDKIVPTLNYRKAGTLAPVFAQAGGNPDDFKCHDDPDQFDAFWQHHLCNYLKYLQLQYS